MRNLIRSIFGAGVGFSFLLPLATLTITRTLRPTTVHILTSVIHQSQGFEPSHFFISRKKTSVQTTTTRHSHVQVDHGTTSWMDNIRRAPTWSTRRCDFSKHFIILYFWISLFHRRITLEALLGKQCGGKEGEEDAEQGKNRIWPWFAPS